MNCVVENKYKIEKFTSPNSKNWDCLISAARNGSFLFFRDYMDYHSTRFIDESVLVFSGQRVIAVFPCNREGSTAVSHGGLTYGGLISGMDVGASDVLVIFEELGKYFKSIGISKVLYKAIPHVFHSYPVEEDLYALIRMGAKMYRRDISSVIELSKRPKFSDSRKNTFRKSIKAGVAIQEIDDFSGFHELLSAALMKFGTSPVHSLEELMLLKNRFPEKIRLYGAMLDKNLLAAALIYDYGHIVHTQYLASSGEGRKIGALDHLLVTLIEGVFSHKNYLSFGISTEENGLYLNEGLIRQKEGFGARGIAHDFYEWIL